MLLIDLPPNSYPEKYNTYINTLDPDTNLVDGLEISLYEFIRFVQSIPLGKHDYRYAVGKWTIKDIIQHLIDCERIFSYRALRLGRNDQSQLVSFDENEYAEQAGGNLRTLQNLLTELSTVRQSTLLLYKNFTAEQLHQQWVTGNNEVSLAALGFIIIGHQEHHKNIFKERYL
ncbi:DinB family protein [Flavobacterium ardleyense]|uniref:DinB family protein n=1 Tax=Flavobacterium ardleyense TaxID=2038737 RepID=UPI00298C45FB|nr:DinB family protein [Flavobacterium ardleyense]